MHAWSLYLYTMHDKLVFRNLCRSQLKDTILEGGIPFNRAHGMHIFEYVGLDPRFNKHFNTAMYNYTSLVMSNIRESYKGFDNIKQLVDVGGSLKKILLETNFFLIEFI